MQLNFKNKKKGFTLVEMLIVIVIIGILATALIPRLTSARGRANDTARKADLQQLAAALVTYQIDYGKFPADNTEPLVSTIEEDLQKVGMSTAPSDPNSDRAFQAVAAETATECRGDGTTDGAGEYQYRTISKNNIARAGFVLVAGAETVGGANRLLGANCIKGGTELSEIDICDKISDDTNVPTECQYDVTADLDTLRYIYAY